MNNSDLSQRSRLVFGGIGLAVLAAGAGVLIYGANPEHSGSTYYTASFGKAGQGMDNQSDVKIRGIAVGGVESVTLGKNGRAIVRFRVDNGIKLPVTTKATIEPLSVFGPKDLDLDLGSGEGSPEHLPDGGAVTQTQDPSELSDTAWPTYRLTTAISPEELAGIVKTFADGLRGEGPALNRTIVNAGKLVDGAYGDRADIKQLVGDVPGLADTFGSRASEIIQLTADFNALSPAINARPDKIAQLLDGISNVSGTVDTNLKLLGNKPGQLIDSSGKVVHVLYAGRANTPQLIDSLIGFFAGIKQIIRVDGPQSTKLAQVYNYIAPLDICQTFVDLCGTPKGATK